MSCYIKQTLYLDSIVWAINDAFTWFNKGEITYKICCLALLVADIFCLYISPLVDIFFLLQQ